MFFTVFNNYEPYSNLMENHKDKKANHTLITAIICVKGVYFVLEEDMKNWSSIKMSKETRCLITILRHCGRMCEIRSGGYLRYALIESY